MVKDLRNSNGNWDLHKINLIFSEKRDREDISKIFLSHSTEEDRRIWTATNNRDPSTKSAYKCILKRRFNHSDPNISWKSY